MLPSDMSVQTERTNIGNLILLSMLKAGLTWMNQKAHSLMYPEQSKMHKLEYLDVTVPWISGLCAELADHGYALHLRTFQRTTSRSEKRI